jgi:hypothetical protein
VRSIIGSDDAAASGTCQKSHLSGRTRIEVGALSVAHYSLTIFVALNVARAIAYWPQIVSIYRDPGCANAVSLWTWIVFTAANVATVIYALGGLEDLIVAAVFAVNAIGCAAIVMLTTYKRCRHDPLVRKDIGADCYPGQTAIQLGVNASPLQRRLGWCATRSAARQRYIQDIIRKGLAAIE